MILIVIALLIFFLVIVITCIRIVPQSQAFVIERLGGYLTTWPVGIRLKAPIIDKIVAKVSQKEQVLDFPPQPVITKDNVTIMIDTVVYLQVTDPKLYTYGVENPISAIEHLSSTTLRNIIGELELDGTLTSRDVINTRMRSVLYEATDSWGIKVNRVEVKNIIPPDSIQEAMEKQMRAERERRESILIAEGQKQSAILVAEGKKEAAIREAEAQKEAKILEAEAQKQAMILEAEAQREAAIRKAEGEAEAIKLTAEAQKIATIKNAEGEADAILAVQTSTAEGLEKIKAARPDAAVIKMRSLEALEKAADGKATKIIIPADIQNLAGLVAALSELDTEGKAAKLNP